MKRRVKKIQNSQGSVFYGMHFYSGVAEYHDPGSPHPYRVFVNEDTIRKMNPSFAGRPVFVLHVDEIPEDVDELRKAADGWVSESFFNAADGKHWVKFIVVTEKGKAAIAQGMRLSNCYVPKQFGPGGLWNGVQYAKEVKNGEYEHLAIVPNPRYDESVILTPEQFKAYNESKNIELQRLANANNGKKGEGNVKFFTRQKVENADAIGETLVLLPKAKREITINALVTEADTLMSTPPAGAATVDVNGEMLTIEQLLEKYQALLAEFESDDDVIADDDLTLENDEDDDKEKEKEPPVKKKKENAEESDDEEKDEKKMPAKKKNDADDAAKAARAAAKVKADALRNAANVADEETVVVDLAPNQLARGKSRYGS